MAVEFIALKKPEKARHCCRLAETFFNEGKRVLVVVQDEAQGRALDRFMWTWRKTSFIPHTLAGEAETAPEPVLITTDRDTEFHAEVLIMAAPCSIEFIRRFERVYDFAELHDPALHQESRQRFSRYREEGLEPRMQQ